jgi:hypothetical protein
MTIKEDKEKKDESSQNPNLEEKSLSRKAFKEKRKIQTRKILQQVHFLVKEKTRPSRSPESLHKTPQKKNMPLKKKKRDGRL